MLSKNGQDLSIFLGKENCRASLFNVCATYFEARLLGAYKFRTTFIFVNLTFYDLSFYLFDKLYQSLKYKH